MEGQPAEKFAFQRILFCTDFSDTADRAFRYALDLYSRYNSAALILLHVIPEPGAQFWKTYLYEVDGVDNLAVQHIQEKITQSYRSQIPPEVKLEVEIRAGRDSVQILECAKEKKVDLIVIGRQGKSSFRRVLFGNVTEKIARQADYPVLIVPASYLKKF
jgi:nucleotide-binding universal stress UspA family protein